MTRRYYVPDLPTDGGMIALSTSEAQHAIRVMRVSVGQSITLFDGLGNEAEATIESIGRNECVCAANRASVVNRELEHSLHLAIALPKPDRAKEMIERLTEIGVTKVTPLVTERVQRPPSSSLTEKLQRVVIEACKQSGRNQRLEIAEVCQAADFFQQAHRGERLLAHPDDQADSKSLRPCSAATTVAIGPEGGFSDHEVDMATQHQFQIVTLGPRIYRVETAATVVASVISLGMHR